MSTREKILAAADALFGEVGFDAASTRDIAALSGVNKPLVHYHFKNKEDLLRAVLDRYYEKLTLTLQAQIARKGDARDQIVRLIGVYVDFLSANRNFSRIVQREASGGKNVAQIAERTYPIFQIGMRFISDAFPATRKGDLAASHLFISFYGMIVTYFTYNEVLEHLFKSDPLSEKNLRARKRHLRRMAELILAEIEYSPQHRTSAGRLTGRPEA